jgi:hypothetical protein
LHARNAAAVLWRGWPAETILTNPKPPSFTWNLRGNYRPVTADYLNTRMIGIRGADGQPVNMPAPSEYGFSERLQQREAARLGMGRRSIKRQAGSSRPAAANTVSHLFA